MHRKVHKSFIKSYGYHSYVQYNAGVPEKLIAETSGHKSTKALRQYEHT